MAKQFQLRRGTTSEHNTFTGVVGEVTVDTTKNVSVIHDGSTAGGLPNAARANTDGTISLIKKDGTSAGEVNSAGLFNNTLTSTNTNQALTAAQGKVLKDTKLEITSALGINQTYQDLTTSRSIDTVYTNSDTRPRFVVVVGSTNNGSIVATVGGSVLPSQAIGNTITVNIGTWFIVPPATTYKVSGGVLVAWSEMKV